MSAKYHLSVEDSKSEKKRKDFKKWSSGVNPGTGRKIKVNGAKWLSIAKEEGYILEGAIVASSSGKFECPVCFEDVSQTKQIQCSCGYGVCDPCCRQYILSEEADSPKCMECKVDWTQSFLYDTFTKSWMTSTKKGGYREAVKKLLLEKEKARLEEASDLLQAPYLVKKENNDIQARGLVQDSERSNYMTIKEALLKSDAKSGPVLIKKIKTNAIPSKRYIYHCPLSCAGLVTGEDECSVCETQFCKQCRELPDGNHVCDPNTVKTILAMAKETRPCPKCAGPIFKTGGCDQMWCTTCNVPFSWRTGLLETGHVHNPYGIAWKREHGGIARARGDVVCGGMPQTNEIEKAIDEYFDVKDDKKKKDKKPPNVLDNFGILKMIVNLGRLIGEIGGIIVEINDILTDSDNLLLYYRILYMLKKKTEVKWQADIYKAYRDNLKARTARDILQTLHENTIAMTREWFQDIKDAKDKKDDEWIKEKTITNYLNNVYNLKDYINNIMDTEMSKLGKTVPFVFSVNYTDTLTAKDVM